MKPQAKTTLYPTSAEALGSFPTAVWRDASIIWADVGGTITVVPFDADTGDTAVAFTIPDASTVPVMVKKVVSIGTASGVKRIY